MLTIGLDILRILAEAEGPLTATAIASRVGLHVSNVSRTLRVLAEHGYVRKPTYHSFAVDIGMLALAGSAASRLPAVARTRQPLAEAAAAAGMHAALAALHRDQVLYLHRAAPGQEVISAVAGGWPLHLSVVGLRLLLDRPARVGKAALERAARRYGWERPTPATPADPAACLAAARERLHDGILRTDHWDTPGDTAAAIAISIDGQPPLALALHGRCLATDPSAHLKHHLLAAAAAVATALQEPS